MNYKLLIRPDALSDIKEAAKWYEEKEPGLGAVFVRDILEGIDRLPTNPLIHRQRDRRRNVRWFFPHRFPYRIIYQIQDHTITVFAVPHAARHERHWKQRI